MQLRAAGAHGESFILSISVHILCQFRPANLCNLGVLCGPDQINYGLLDAVAVAELDAAGIEDCFGQIHNEVEGVVAGVLLEALDTMNSVARLAEWESERLFVLVL